MADRRTYFNTASGVTAEYPVALADISTNLIEVVDEPTETQPEPTDQTEQTPAPATPKRVRAKASTDQEED